MDVQELRPGLWRWTAPHPEWEHAENWGPEVGSVYAELPEAVVVIDPLVPTEEDEQFWSALDRDIERLARPVHVLLTVHWHERSVAAVDLDAIARVHEERDLHDGARLECRRLGDVRDGVALHARLSLRDSELDGGRELDA